MTAKKSESDYCEHSIYLLEAQGSAYIGRCKSGTEKATYRRHRTGNCAETHVLFGGDEAPEMYVLATVTSSVEEAYRYRVAWGRRLQELGYAIVGRDSYIMAVANLMPRTADIYDTIRDASLEDIKEHRVDTEAQVRPARQQGDSRQISVSVTAADNKVISRKAAKMHMSKSAYCRQAALQGVIVNVKMPNYHEEMDAERQLTQRLVDKAIACEDRETRMSLFELIKTRQAYQREYAVAINNHTAVLRSLEARSR